MTSPIPYAQVRSLRWSLAAQLPQLRRAEVAAHYISTIDDYRLDMVCTMLKQEARLMPLVVLIEQQPEIKLGMRPLLLDFLMEVICILNLSPLTFPLTVNLIDRYCLTRIVKKQHYQLLGLTCLWVACKQLDQKYKMPTLADLGKICVDYYYKELFIEMEKHVLKLLEWRVLCPTVDAYIELYVDLLTLAPTLGGNLHGSTVASKRMIIVQVATYIGELFQFYPNIYFEYPTSQLAMIATLVAILNLDVAANVAICLTHLNGCVKPETEEDIFTPQQFRRLFRPQFFKNVAKMISNPPKSLSIKYFGEQTKFPHFKLVIDGVSRHLLALVEPPVTPRVSVLGAQLPLTPVLNSTSPKLDCIMTPVMTTYPVQFPYLPAVLISPKKRPLDRQLVGEVKKMKLFEAKPVFFIP